MLRRTLLLAAVALLSSAAPARAVTVEQASAGEQASIARLVAAARVPVVSPQTVIIAPCPGYPDVAGCNFESIDPAIYIHPGMLSADVLYRELGGRFETVEMDAGEQHRFITLARPQGDEDPGELFEDAYADCAEGRVPPRHLWSPPDLHWVDAAGYEPSRRTHRQICGLIRRSA